VCPERADTERAAARGFREGRPRTQRSQSVCASSSGVGKESFSSLERVSLAERSSGLTEVCDVRCATPSEPDGSREFGWQAVPIVLCEFDATDVVRPGGLLDVIVDFGETAAVGVARLVIDDREACSDAFGHGIQAVVDGGTGWECAPLHSDAISGVQLFVRYRVLPLERRSGRGSAWASQRWT
jgi:hypothetical protein